MNRKIAILLTASVLATGHAGAQTVTLFPPSVYDPDTAAMDAAVGITGFAIGSFEDTTLIPDLTIEHVNPNVGPTGTLQNLTLDETCGFVSQQWDGPGILVSTDNNNTWYPVFPCAGGTMAEKIIFHIDPPVTSFGVGLSNFRDTRDHAVFVNGIEIVSVLDSLPEFESGNPKRNGYLKVDSAPGQGLVSIAIEVRNEGTTTPIGGSTSDGLVFDHLALGPAASPSTPGEALDLRVTDFDLLTDEVSLEYMPGCASVNHNVVYGLLEEVATYAYLGNDCSSGSSGNHILALPGNDSYFFIVVANDGDDTEGSYGRNSALVERPADPLCFANQVPDASCF